MAETSKIGLHDLDSYVVELLNRTGSGSGESSGTASNTKLVVNHLHVKATADNQKEFTINLNTFNASNDTVHVQSNGLMLFPGEDFIVQGKKIVLTEGVPVGRDIGIYIYQNVITDEDGTLVAPGSGSSGGSKLYMYNAYQEATVDGQTEFDIPIASFDETEDALWVFEGYLMLHKGLDYTLKNGKVVLTEGVQKGCTISMYVIKQVEQTDEEKLISGLMIEPASIPLDRLAEEVSGSNVSGQIAEHNTSSNAHSGMFAKASHTHVLNDVGISYSSTDLTAGSSSLATGAIHLVFE